MENCNFQHVLLERAHPALGLPSPVVLGLSLILTGAVLVKIPKGWEFFFPPDFDPKELELQRVESDFVTTASPQNFSLLQAVCRCQNHGKVVKLFKK